MSASLEKLTKQMYAVNPRNKDVVGNVQENLSKEIAQKLQNQTEK